jgi:hypothetical protein
MTETITLTRHEYGEQGTRGRLVLPDGWECLTIELPWRGNRVGKSCVPEGVYDLALRRSGVVERTTNGDYLEGWEVTGVPGRTYIMVHVANVPSELAGCIAVGQRPSTMWGLPAVSNSQRTFDVLMERLATRSAWVIDIRHADGVEAPQWP